MQAMGRHARGLLAGWLKMRDGDELCPRKAALSPAAMMPILADMLVLEHQGIDFWRIRLMGTHVVRRLGRDFTGASPLDYTPPRHRKIVGETLGRVVGEPCAHLEDRIERLCGGGHVAVQSLRLPLLDSAGHCRFVVNSTEEMGLTQAGRPPLDPEAAPVSTFIALADLDRVAVSQGENATS